ncbi:hypothetical protein K474DRAFT_474979 [Panus rudis PR-1116 ss-1]|nr:hypothetical protein K474DRAFT_474979 [Panus rudis PR-1116 ss-1]
MAPKATKEPRAFCEICQTFLNREEDLGRHMSSLKHGGSRTHPCPWVGCDYVATQESNVTNHLKTQKHGGMEPPAQLKKTPEQEQEAIRRANNKERFLALKRKARKRDAVQREVDKWRKSKALCMAPKRRTRLPQRHKHVYERPISPQPDTPSPISIVGMLQAGEMPDPELPTAEYWLSILWPSPPSSGCVELPS